MLVRLNNKTVRGETFRVSVPDIHHVRCEEAGKLASVDIEGGVGPNGEVNWVVFRETLRNWDSPDELLGMPHQFV